MVGSLRAIAVKEEELGGMPMIRIVHALAAAPLICVTARVTG